MTGLLLIDKPEGLSSFDVVRRVRRSLKIKRVGHGGTLDPFATGLLPVAVGDATRLLEYLLGDWKRYRAVMCLGIATDTLDKTGRVIAQTRPDDGIHNRLDEVFAAHTGLVMQVPPMYSALKRDGVPLYKLARRGAEVERKARQIEIRELKLLAVEGDDVSFEVYCSKGTYVRTLADDIGRELGCGAHLTALRRLASGPFSLDDALPLETIETWDWSTPHPRLLSPLQAMSGYPVGQLSCSARQRLAHGVPPAAVDVAFDRPPEAGELVCLATEGQLLAMARFAPAREREKRGDFELCKVFNT
ncbi:tRNA pseudouridine(55) synthase TruB [Geothermobacter hydrogeniphilus]|uniref:tRNA pseudouridine synthase B n=1 Tax=Geothermobacter hydrogeniphilus TaxID=1969733 RepID=A0A2K2HD16_9BACT|nr:tRNA pseudouridine(55) synthase TruB [Geothermobacter hydrogeniphilus]PNU21187.1 tRNA pseudouridine(55) synthase TruB [Geothermobacter hydrogeniphilus]